MNETIYKEDNCGRTMLKMTGVNEDINRYLS